MAMQEEGPPREFFLAKQQRITLYIFIVFSYQHVIPKVMQYDMIIPSFVIEVGGPVPGRAGPGRAGPTHEVCGHIVIAWGEGHGVWGWRMAMGVTL